MVLLLSPIMWSEPHDSVLEVKEIKVWIWPFLWPCCKGSRLHTGQFPVANGGMKGSLFGHGNQDQCVPRLGHSVELVPQGIPPAWNCIPEFGFTGH